MLPESPREPYPITWDEQNRLFPLLPPHLGRMVLFAVNTGLRDNNVCGLQWSWEVSVPEVRRSVFVIPAEAFKSKCAHVVILNDVGRLLRQANLIVNRQQTRTVLRVSNGSYFEEPVDNWSRKGPTAAKRTWF